MKRVLLIFLVFLLCPVFIFAVDKIELNTASLAQLDELVGIGPTIAQRIIDGRPYSSVDDLTKVKGIGEKTLQDIKTQGLAHVAQGEPGKSETLNPKSETSSKSEIQITETYPLGIIINEILPSPEGADETNEFIELYNSTGGEIDISGWKLRDIEGTQTTYTFPTGTKINGSGYISLTRVETKILLNNDADGVNLLWPDGKITDTVSFGKAITKQSYNKTSTGWQWSILPTPGAVNKIAAVAAKPKALPKAKKTDNKVTIAPTSTNPNLAALSESVKSGGQNPWLLFLVAAGIAIISGAVFLLLKLTIFKTHVRP